MAGNKRTRSGQVKPSGASQQPLADAPVTEPTTPCAQPQLPYNTTTEAPGLVQAKEALKPPNAVKSAQQAPPQPRTHARKHAQRQKLPKLPTSRCSLNPAAPYSPLLTKALSRCIRVQASPYPPSNPHSIRFLPLTQNPLHNRHHALCARLETYPQTTF
jgi:ribonuclease P/MRP protein subunit POP7